jgi:hypothetical protein
MYYFICRNKKNNEDEIKLKQKKLKEINVQFVGK